MRTTVDIQDDVLRQAKVASAQSGVTLSVWITDALRKSLAPKGEPKERFQLPRYTPSLGGTFPGIDLNDNAAMTAFLEPNRDAALVALLYGEHDVDS